MPPSALISGSHMGSFLSHPPPVLLKRPRAASAPCESEEARRRKRSRGNTASFLIKETIMEDVQGEETNLIAGGSHKGKGKARGSLLPGGHSVLGGVTTTVIEELAQELKCGCCTELCYNPVIVNPCQHFFCGSCCILWVRNGGANCPACRSVSTSVTPSRVLQSMIDVLLRSDPSKARTESERMQADQVYRVGTSLRLPTPRPVTPEPNLEPPNDNFARPCPTCLAGNPYGWRCPIPIQDPAIDPENAFDLDDGAPPGHAFCGNCDQLHNVQAPTSTKCDFCQVSFCGVGIQGRCCALGLLSQQPQGMTDLPDIILSGAIYDSFHGNSVEVDILVDYLRTNEITLRGVYKEIVAYTLQQPTSFTPFIDSGIFDDLHAVPGGDDPDPLSPRRRICRLCAAQLLIHGFKDWWIRERKHGNVPDDVLARKDCLQGSGCGRQDDPAHSKEFNHIIPNPAVVSANDPPAPGSINALPSIHNASAIVAPSQQLGLIFHPSDIDILPRTPTLEDDLFSGISVLGPLARSGVEATTNRRPVEGTNGAPFDSVRLDTAPLDSAQLNNAPAATVSGNGGPNDTDMDHSESTSSVGAAMTIQSLPTDSAAAASVPVSHVPPVADIEDVVMVHDEAVERKENRVSSAPEDPSMHHQQQQPAFGEEITELLASMTSSSRAQALPLLPTI